jgi:hypothetical protein
MGQTTWKNLDVGGIDHICGVGGGGGCMHLICFTVGDYTILEND